MKDRGRGGGRRGGGGGGGGGRGGELLAHVQRYDRLNHILSLLQDAREGGGEGGGGGGKISEGELGGHIRVALEEAVRLRADTEALQHRTLLKVRCGWCNGHIICTYTQLEVVWMLREVC